MRLDEDPDELANELRHSLRDIKAPEALKAKVLTSLRDNDLLQNPNVMKTRTTYLLAAAVVGILIGFAGSFLIAGNGERADPFADANKFLLMLHEDSTFSATPDESPRLVREYTEWAIDLAKAGKLVSAEKLANDHVVLGKVSSDHFPVSGYFVIVANDLDDARRIAATHPHLGYNGGIELRAIE